MTERGRLIGMEIGIEILTRGMTILIGMGRLRGLRLIGMILTIETVRA
jgi:hypothetical protein